jgi:hypothetical protein
MNESIENLEFRLAAAEQRAEQAEADCASILAELKHTQICLGNIDCRADTDALIEQIDEYFEKDNLGSSLLAELAQLREGKVIYEAYDGSKLDKMARHASTQLTADIYCHVTPAIKNRVARKMDNILGGIEDGSQTNTD